MAAVGADGTGGIDVSTAVMKGALLRLSPRDIHRLVFGALFQGDVFQRLALLSPGESYRLHLGGLHLCGLLQGGGLHCFFQLEPTLFDVLRFFQLTVSRHY